MASRIDHKAVWGAGYHAGVKAASAKAEDWKQLRRIGLWSLQAREKRLGLEHNNGYWTENVLGHEGYSFARHIAAKGWQDFILEDFLAIWCLSIEMAERKPAWLTPDWMAREIRLAIKDHAEAQAHSSAAFRADMERMFSATNPATYKNKPRGQPQD